LLAEKRQVNRQLTTLTYEHAGGRLESRRRARQHLLERRHLAITTSVRAAFGEKKVCRA